MKYGCVIPGTFVSRPNRFIALVDTEQGRETVHVKNTGRCRELLVPGCRVWLAVSDNPARKTRCDLIAAEKGGMPVNLDSQLPNEAAEEWLRAGHLFPSGSLIRREVTHGDSRFDFYLENGDRRAFLEVKGCTLERDGVALFPDAPTERGVKHLNGLAACVSEGYEAYVLFVIQMKGVREFRPNEETHPEFANALRRAAAAGVRVLAVDCAVAPDSVIMDAPVPVLLEKDL